MVTIYVGPRIVGCTVFSQCDLSRGEKCISRYGYTNTLYVLYPPSFIRDQGTQNLDVGARQMSSSPATS